MNKNIAMLLVLGSMITMTVQVKACWHEKVYNNESALHPEPKNYGPERWFNQHYDREACRVAALKGIELQEAMEKIRKEIQMRQKDMSE